MKRALCITASMNAGGAETFMMKLYRAMDRTRYQMDFCVSVGTNYYEAEIVGLGGRVYVVPLKSKHPVSSFNAIRRLVRDNGYESVIRVNEHALSTLDLIAAHAGGAKRLIMRSSNSSSGSACSTALHYLFRPLTRIVPDARIAPSGLAAEYTFGRGCLERGVAEFFPNGLDLSEFSFDEVLRAKTRAELNLEDSLVIGHIGRFNKQKNHEFLLEAFSFILQRCPHSVLVLVGDGILEDDVRSQAERLGIADSVRMVGVRNDVPALLSAFDVFALPSLYEGMPNVVIEAQASGLPCVISDAITREANVTGRVTYLPIDSPKDWADPVVRAAHSGRYDGASCLRSAGYDIHQEVGRFVELVYG